MDTMVLTVFVEVARRGSFTAAASSLGYTQSAISRQVATLEGEYSEVLFDRLPRGVRLTDAGRCLLPHAEAVAGRLAAAAHDIRALRSLTAGRLRVGAFPTADTALVPRAVAAFRAAHPAVELSFGEGFVRDLVTRLRDGGLDVAVVTSTVPGLLDGLELRHVLDDRMFVAVPPAHWCAGRASVRLAELADDDWIAGNSRLEETLFSAIPGTADGFRPRISYVIREWVAKQGFVAAGLGITLIPSLAAGSARPDVVLVPLHPDDSPVRVIYAATPAGVTPPAALDSFLGFLSDAAAALPDPRRLTLPDPAARVVHVLDGKPQPVPKAPHARQLYGRYRVTLKKVGRHFRVLSALCRPVVPAFTSRFAHHAPGRAGVGLPLSCTGQNHPQRLPTLGQHISTRCARQPAARTAQARIRSRARPARRA